MKKLLLILSAVFVSVMGWAASLNPYAYNLSSTWNEATSELTVRFKLNAHPNMKENSSGRGIQIFAIDPSNNKRYYIYGVPGDIIKAKMNEYNGGKGDSYDYELTIPITGKTWDNKDFLPVGKNLTWAVKVAGLNNTDKSTPTAPVYVNQARRPYSCHGVAVNNNQNSPDFGSVYVTEAAKDDELSETWAWLKGKGKALLKYDPRMQDAVSYRKTSAFSNRDVDNCLLEPHRVCVSEDGRVFVSSYNKCKTKDEPVVWEFKNGQFTPVIYYYPGDGIYGDRVCGMAVKGSGADLRIMLCYIDEPNAHPSAFRMYEYDLNNLGTNKNEGNWRGSYAPEGNTTDGSTASVQGAFTKAISNKWYFYSDGLANVSYLGNGHVLAVDFFVGYGANAVLRYYEGTNKKSENAITASNKQGYYYGGAGLLAYQDDDGKYIVSGRTYYYGYESNPNTNETNGRIHTYTLSNTTISSSPKSGWSLTGVKTRSIINAMAMDCAKNIYAVSFTDGTENVGTGQLLAFAMPYSGETTTIAPSSNAATNRYFNIKPIPNILATDLHYEPVGTTDKYAFSFITNTKPTVAEIRFYKKNNRGNMDSNIATIHADNYDENAHKTIEPDYVYRFQGTELKQGLMEKTFTMVGGDPNQKELTDALPPGEMYWSVYVKTDKSSCFAPIYRSGYYPQESIYEPLHAIVNNYPATDMFGHLIVTNNNESTTEHRPDNGLLIYGLNPSGAEQTQDGINTTRYVKRNEYLNGKKSENGLVFLTYPRRMAMTPDGKVYIADEGQCTVANNAAATTVAYHNYGGVKIWDPAAPNEFKLFSDNKIGTSTSVALWNGKLYATNTYEEYLKHISNGDDGSASNYTKAQQYVNGVFGWNGFVEYNLDAYYNTPNNGTWKDFWKFNSRATEVALGRGDESGNITLVPMEKGIWLCQSREDNWIVKKETKQPLADNLGSYLLSFVPFSRTTTTNEYGPRTWRSCTSDGIKNFTTTRDPDTPAELTQKENSLLQSTPGAGMAYRKVNGVEYLYIVNHEGNILQMQIEWQNNTTPLIHESKITKFQTPSTFKYNKDNGWKNYSFINSMDFDYAGNLVTITGDRISHFNKKHEIVIYTMAYDRTNAQEIRASDSYIYIPERLHQMAMEEVDIQGVLNRHTSDGACAVDLYRPLQGGMFNTICLPFVLEMDHLNNPLAGSEVRQFTRATIESIGGENILCLEFTEVSTIQFNIPYIIKPQQNIKQIMRFNWPVTLATTTAVDAITSKNFEDGNNITYQGLLSKSLVAANPLRLILVADNRLAVITKDGDMYGFRGYFDLAKPLPPGTVAKISAKKDTPTNTTIVVDGKKVNIEKYLREGRVYIRVGDSLYTVDGQLVK